MKPPVIPSKLDYIGSDFLDGGTPEDGGGCCESCAGAAGVWSCDAQRGPLSALIDYILVMW